MIMDDHGWFSLLGVRRGSTGFFLEGGVLEDQWQDPMAKFYTETNLGPLSQASWSFFSVIFVLFCSVLFCEGQWWHYTWPFFFHLHCHRTGPIGQTQKAIEARLSAAASCGAPVEGPVLSRLTTEATTTWKTSQSSLTLTRPDPSREKKSYQTTWHKKATLSVQS